MALLQTAEEGSLILTQGELFFVLTIIFVVILIALIIWAIVEVVNANQEKQRYYNNLNKKLMEKNEN